MHTNLPPPKDKLYFLHKEDNHGFISKEGKLDFIRKETIKHGTTLLVDIAALAENYKMIGSHCPTAKVSAVIKNNAYGLGVENIAPVLYNSGCRDFFVSTFTEALELKLYQFGSNSPLFNNRFNGKESYIYKGLKRDNHAVIPPYVKGTINRNGELNVKIKGSSHLNDQVNIYVLHGLLEGQEEEFYKNNLVPVLNTLSQIKLWNNFAIKQNVKLPCILHLETGLLRLGLISEDVNQLHNHPELFENLNIIYIMSHFARADEDNHPSVKEQYDNFVNQIRLLPKSRYSLCSSYGIYTNNDFHLDLIRPAISLYGGNPMPYKPNIMKSVIYLNSSIFQIKDIKAGDKVGYGHTWQATKDGKIGILPIGYADGVLRSSSNKGFVYIDNIKVNMIGRVSMDLVAIDITDLPKHLQKEKQVVEIIGDNISINLIAQNANTINCEILNILTNRYPRYFL
ncbi:Alanine racemase, biosynthetic [Candidatus Hepatincolaceae symbiont of Richtersius coronifer]